MTEKTTDTPATRPFFLSILCVSLFVYTGTLSLIFLLTVLFSEWVSNTLTDFFPERDIETGNILLLALLAFLLSTVSFVGTYLIWRLKRVGFYLFTIASALLLILPFLLGSGNYYSLWIILGVIVLLALYYRRFN